MSLGYHGIDVELLFQFVIQGQNPFQRAQSLIVFRGITEGIEEQGHAGLIGVEIASDPDLHADKVRENRTHLLHEIVAFQLHLLLIRDDFYPVGFLDESDFDVRGTLDQEGALEKHDERRAHRRRRVVTLAGLGDPGRFVPAAFDNEFLGILNEKAVLGFYG